MTVVSASLLFQVMSIVITNHDWLPKLRAFCKDEEVLLQVPKLSINSSDKSLLALRSPTYLKIVISSSSNDLKDQKIHSFECLEYSTGPAAFFLSNALQDRCVFSMACGKKTEIVVPFCRYRQTNHHRTLIFCVNGIANPVVHAQNS